MYKHKYIDKGDTEPLTFEDEIPISTMGWDGRNGNQPRGIQIIGNFVHELGIWESLVIYVILSSLKIIMLFIKN